MSAGRATIALMPHTAGQLQLLVANCEQFRDAEAPKGYPDSLALCIVDSIQSTGVRYPAVEKVVARYRSYRRDRGGDPNIDGTAELLDTFKDCGGPDGWSKKIGNGHRTSTRAGAPLKAVAIHDAANVLAAEGITSSAGLREADSSRRKEIEAAWRKVVGQRSGITWRYAGMLAGVDGVKPDRMICRFVADSLVVKRSTVTTEFAAAIVEAAADELGMTAFALDHAIWRFQRGRK